MKEITGKLRRKTEGNKETPFQGKEKGVHTFKQTSNVSFLSIPARKKSNWYLKDRFTVSLLLIRCLGTIELHNCDLDLLNGADFLNPYKYYIG